MHNKLQLCRHTSTVQKDGVPGFSGCVEQTSNIHNEFKAPKWTNKKDIIVVWLELAYDTIHHMLILDSLDQNHITDQSKRV